MRVRRARSARDPAAGPAQSVSLMYSPGSHERRSSSTRASNHPSPRPLRPTEATGEPVMVDRDPDRCDRRRFAGEPLHDGRARRFARLSARRMRTRRSLIPVRRRGEQPRSAQVGRRVGRSRSRRARRTSESLPNPAVPPRQPARCDIVSARPIDTPVRPQVESRRTAIGFPVLSSMTVRLPSGS